MNTNTKLLTLAGVLTLGLTGSVNAQSKVFMTGSTAGRAAIFATMTDLTANGVFDVGTATFLPATATGSSSKVNFRGLISGVDTMVKCSFSGSEAGYADVAGSVTESFLNDSGNAGDPADNEVVDICAADNAPQFSKLTSAQQALVTATFVANIPFKWEKEKGSSANLVNVTDQALRQAFKGNAKLALFSGNAADLTYVYISGRDSGSGTRVNSQGDCGFGIFATPQMAQIAADGSMTKVDGVHALGDFTAPNFQYGYSSGGTLATQMGNDLSQVTSVDIVPLHGGGHFSIVAYLGIGDATTAEGLGAVNLTYDGIPYSIANIIEGQYNLWGNYHVVIRNAGVNAQAPAVIGQLTLASPKGIDGHADSTVLIKKSDMHATRTGPTGDPVHK